MFNNVLTPTSLFFFFSLSLSRNQREDVKRFRADPSLRLDCRFFCDLLILEERTTTSGLVANLGRFVNANKAMVTINCHCDGRV